MDILRLLIESLNMALTHAMTSLSSIGAVGSIGTHMGKSKLGKMALNDTVSRSAAIIPSKLLGTILDFTAFWKCLYGASGAYGRRLLF
jgi:hypothetical protein